MAVNQPVIDKMVLVKPDVRKRVETAVSAVLLLCWRWRDEQFRWEDHPELSAEVNAILRDMSDGVKADIERRALDALTEMELADFYDEAIDYAESDIDDVSFLYRLDMHASHLREIIAGWLAVAAVCVLTREETKANLLAYLGNPALSPLWQKTGLPVLKWGRGNIRNVIDGMALIGQDAVNRAYQFAAVRRFALDETIVGYRTRRNSGYDCPLCDEMTERVWPLDVTVLPYHPRCVCYAVPVTMSEMMGL